MTNLKSEKTGDQIIVIWFFHVTKHFIKKNTHVVINGKFMWIIIHTFFFPTAAIRRPMFHYRWVMWSFPTNWGQVAIVFYSIWWRFTTWWLWVRIMPVILWDYFVFHLKYIQLVPFRAQMWPFDEQLLKSQKIFNFLCLLLLKCYN